MISSKVIKRYVRNAGSLKMTAFVQGVPPEIWLCISNFDTVNIIQSIWEFIQFLYMLLEAKSQNFIGMGWKMNDLCMSILTWVKFKCAPFLETLKKPFWPLWSRYEAVFAARGFKNISIIPRVLIDKPHLDFYKYLN